MNRKGLLFTLSFGVLLLGILLLLTRSAERIMAQQTTRTFTAEEYIRNGTFDANNTSWAISPTWSYVDATGGQDGGPGLRLNHLSNDGPALALQMLHLPTTVARATLSYVVRIEPGSQPPGVLATFGVQIFDEGTIHFQDGYQINSAVDWTPINVTLPETAINAIQQAFNEGKQIYLRFVLVNGEGAFYTAFVDNASLRIDGAIAYPNLSGSVGFLSQQGQQPSVERIQPDGSGRQTMWQHPSAFAPNIYSIAWSPDGQEIAFVSDHEGVYSPFHSDIYALAADGSNLRRISNAPMHAGWPHGRQTGAVTGRIYNGHASFGYTFVVYIEGAQEVVAVSMPEFGQTVDFTFPQVADNGDGALQTIVFNWSRDSCANGKEFSVPVDVLPGQTIDVGTITFNGYCNKYNVSNLTWKSDGSTIAGVMLNGSRRFQRSGESIGRDLFTTPDRLPYDLAWSPVSDQILSTRQTQGLSDGIFLGTAGGDPGSQIMIDNQSTQQNPAWLPGGNGFIFTYNNNTIGRYDISTQQGSSIVTFFNETIDSLTVSPDGNYAAFERRNAQGQADVWVMRLNPPNLMWPLTNDGVSRHPDWSRVNPGNEPSPTPTPIPGVRDQKVYLPDVKR
ncbi:MAG: hypothetical protein EOM24_06100 [Chloroflexia bacterium]|nr:hypothetical protein [Chloroflexia bacterium]